MKIQIRHLTRYVYSAPAELGPHVVRLHPAAHAHASVLSYDLAVSPECFTRWQHDVWGNRVARLTFPADELVSALELRVELAVDVRPVNPFDFFIDDRCETVPFTYPDGLDHELGRYREKRALGPRLADLLEETRSGEPTVPFLVDLCGLVAKRVKYVIRDEPGIRTSEETLEIGSGSCRDSAVLLIDLLRAHGLAARFVSGYLVQLADEGIIPDLPKGVTEDVVDLHAWAEAYIPGAGWIGLDGTSGLLCGEGHIALACSTVPAMAAAATGTASQPASTFEYRLDVARIGHEPSPRRPYTDEQWQAIVEAGAAVDEALAERSVVLTVGGEPTFTSREHPREPEWIVDAIGKTKWTQGLRLANDLRSRFGVGTLAMHQFGKHYPGESLPRWALRIIWRVDGEPVCGREDLLDFGSISPSSAGVARSEPETDPGAIRDALELGERFIRKLAERLDVDANVLAGFEDPWALIRDEEDLPSGVDPLEFDLEASEGRRRLARILDRGPSTAVGHVLPLGREHDRWSSTPWTFRGGHLFLVAGDSPMGLRLPLDRLGPTREMPERDPTALEGELPVDPRDRLRRVREARGATRAGKRSAARTRRDSDDDEVWRTALCVEPRDGALCVFLPPVPEAEDFLELVAVVEDVAAELSSAVRIEGYGPPSDHRLSDCLVTPDPGVLEVNMPPARGFAEYVGALEAVADAANHAGLSTEKYQLDGRAVGSGGGHHITLGGPEPLESPFVRRPDLLASLLRFVQNHPSLSYLFAGLFIGPTSQAPRIDEARHDSLRELELALAQVPKAVEGDTPRPWIVDRLLRNLLIDVSGNTHRTEISIEKLYNPASASGRQGLIELRAFEMPPHERMAAAQILLTRALVARFARAPYSEPLVRWGTELHDRFMLPHFIWRDFEEVARDLCAHDVPLDAEWYRPFLDYRFPVFGEIVVDDVRLELRSAAEPWTVLGEETWGATVSRYVDSSVERLQIIADGVTEGRQVVAVNGVRLPLRATGRAAERVAGVRFRAWQPPHCLQPRIPVHHPLRIDLVDTWGKRSLGACTYHVWHPEGRAYEEPPLTVFEAAARRAQRFTTEGHAQWPVEIRELDTDPESPFTLDLRRASVKWGELDEPDEPASS